MLVCLGWRVRVRRRSGRFLSRLITPVPGEGVMWISIIEYMTHLTNSIDVIIQYMSVADDSSIRNRKQ